MSEPNLDHQPEEAHPEPIRNLKALLDEVHRLEEAALSKLSPRVLELIRELNEELVRQGL